MAAFSAYGTTLPYGTATMAGTTIAAPRTATYGSYGTTIAAASAFATTPTTITSTPTTIAAPKITTMPTSNAAKRIMTMPTTIASTPTTLAAPKIMATPTSFAAPKIAKAATTIATRPTVEYISVSSPSVVKYANAPAIGMASTQVAPMTVPRNLLGAGNIVSERIVSAEELASVGRFLEAEPVRAGPGAIDRASLLAAMVSSSKEREATNPLKIGANVPDFLLITTHGEFSFHDFLTHDAEKPWTIFFSHPNDFTPVCTTELGACHSLNDDFGQLGAKLIGLSCNTTESHIAWSKDVLANMGNTYEESLAFPIIADADREIVSTLGMLDPEERTAEGIPLPARALVILHGTTVKLTILYPATTGRNFEEVKRILISLQLTASNGLATPVDWKYGDRLIVGPAVKTEDAKEKFEDLDIESLPSGKPYLRTVRCLDLTTAMSKTPAVVNYSKPPQGSNPLKIGATIPNFNVKTTKGDFALHSWLASDLEKPWTIFFTHPKDFTPVCTTELGACHKLAGLAAQLGCKLIGLSCDDTESHKAWSKDVLARAGCASEQDLAFPIIADSDRTIVTKLGMLDPEERDAAGVPLPARALLILKDTTVKLSILYPATTGRNFDEVLRTLVSLQLTANNGLATPVDWKYGERVIVGPAVKTEDAIAKFEDFQMKELPSGKPYLRSVRCPDAGLAAP